VIYLSFFQNPNPNLLIYLYSSLVQKSLQVVLELPLTQVRTGILWDVSPLKFVRWKPSLGNKLSIFF